MRTFLLSLGAAILAALFGVDLLTRRANAPSVATPSPANEPGSVLTAASSVAQSHRGYTVDLIHRDIERRGKA